jgi:hypothetical protein
VNNRAKVNVPFGTRLTRLAQLPDGSSRKLDDPYAEKPSRWRLWLFLFVVALFGLAWFIGQFDDYLPDQAKAATVFHRNPTGPAPAGSGVPAASAAPSAVPAPASAAPSGSAPPPAK